jgi:hypothetical protein
MSRDLALFKQKEKKGALAEGRGAYNILQLAHFSFINFRAARVLLKGQYGTICHLCSCTRIEKYRRKFSSRGRAYSSAAE